MAASGSKVRWTRALVNEARDEVLARTDRLASDLDPVAATEKVFEEAARPETNELTRFFLLVEGLHLQKRSGLLNTTEVANIAEGAEAILVAHDVQPKASKLSFLYAELDLALASLELGLGRIGSALGFTQAAMLRARKSNERDDGLHHYYQGVAAYAAGAPVVAMKWLAKASELTEAEDVRLSAVLNYVKAARIAGEHREALTTLRRMRRLAAHDRVWLDQLTWQEGCLAVQETGRVAPLVALAMGRLGEESGYRIEAILWAWAVGDENSMRRLPTARTIRRRSGEAVDSDLLIKRTYRAVRGLLELDSEDQDLALRVRAAGQLIDDHSDLPYELKLLLQAAVARWAFRQNQRELGDVLLASYQTQSLGLSDGRSRDVMGVTPDLVARLKPHQPNPQLFLDMDHSEEDHLPSRLTGLTRIAAGFSKTYVRQRFRRIWHRRLDRDELRLKEMKELAQVIRDEIGTMKGPLMKLGQLLSHIGMGLPEGTRLVFYDLLAQSEPMPSSSVETVFENEMGSSVREVFASWDEKPVACASIGQVHRATLRDGTPVAVKIQYPGMAEAVRQDMRILRFFKPAIARYWPAIDFKSVFAELEERMGEECDYRIEAANQEEFTKLFAGEENMHIPKVFREYSSERVLVTEWAEGERFTEFVTRASQEERNAAAEVIYKFITKSVFQLGYFSADPHPGNFVFNNGRVSFLDFGSVKRWSKPYLKAWRALIESTFERDFHGNAQAWRDLGYVVDENTFDFEWQFKVHSRIVCQLFLRDSPVDPIHDGYDEDVNTLVFNNPNVKVSSLPPEHILGLRVALGLSSVLSQLGSRCNWYRLTMPIFYDDPKKWPRAFSEDELVNMDLEAS